MMRSFFFNLIVIVIIVIVLLDNSLSKCKRFVKRYSLSDGYSFCIPFVLELENTLLLLMLRMVVSIQNANCSVFIFIVIYYVLLYHIGTFFDDHLACRLDTIHGINESYC